MRDTSANTSLLISKVTLCFDTVRAQCLIPYARLMLLVSLEAISSGRRNPRPLLLMCSVFMKGLKQQTKRYRQGLPLAFCYNWLIMSYQRLSEAIKEHISHTGAIIGALAEIKSAVWCFFYASAYDLLTV
jgi:hypothetical protein